MKQNEVLTRCANCGSIEPDLSYHICDPDRVPVKFTQADKDRVKSILKILESK